MFGKITNANSLTVESHMADNGVVFRDGIEQDFLAFNAGMKAPIAAADKRGRLVV